MPRGRTTTLTVTLSPLERQTLEAWQRSQTIQLGLARRGRMVLLRADGRTIAAIAHAVGLSRRFVYLWVRRFQAQGLAGLHDRPRRAFAHRRRVGEATP
jgi:hypothetical protein